MIGVQNQYTFNFNVIKADGTLLEDFLDENNLDTFTMIEEAGNVLPTFELGFRTHNAEILSYLNEGNVLNITFGRSRNDENLVDAKFSILRFSYNRSGESSYVVSVGGVYAALKYLSEDIIAQYPNISGVEAIKTVADTYLNTKFNVSTSEDVQTWLRPNISAKSFINNTWMHSYIAESFIGIGIDSSGTLILNDMKEAVKKYRDEPQWRFTTEPKDSIIDVLYDGDYVVESNTGFMNYWMGYGREKKVYDFETGIDSDVLESPSKLFTASNTFVRTSDILKKTSEVGFQNDNIHDKYWEAYHQNIQSLALFSSHQVSLSFHSVYKPIKILDVIDFSDTEIDAKNQAKAKSSAGRYFVSKVSRNISNRQFVTTVQLCRESITEVQGNLR